MADRGLAGLRRRSPVAGLDRRTLTPVQVFAQSVSAMAPSAAMAASPAIVAASAGDAVMWSFAVATVVALLVGVCIAQFTRRMAAAGSLYSLTAKGLGPLAAFVCGSALLIGYGVLAMAALIGSGIFLTDFLVRLGVAPPGGIVTLGCTLLVLVAGTTVLAIRGVRLSARVVLVTEAVSIGLMLFVFVVLLADVGDGLDVEPFALGHSGFGGAAAGVLPALAAFVGFETAAALGVEAQRPYQTIPRAVQWTVALGGILYLFAAYTQVVKFGDVPGGLGAQDEPLVTLAAAQHAPWLLHVVDIGIATSFFACALATTTALARVLFSLARDGVVPTALGATHTRFRTPHVAILVVAPVVAATPLLVLLAGGTPATTLTTLLTVAAFGYLVAYLLVCLAVPAFLRRIGELTVSAVVAALVIAPVLLAALVAFTYTTLGGPYPLVFGALTAAALAWFGWLRIRRPARLREIGVYDETSWEDVLLGAQREVRR